MSESTIEMKKIILAEKVNEVGAYQNEIQSLNRSLGDAKSEGDFEMVTNLKGLLTRVTDHLVKINGMIDVLNNDIEFETYNH